MPNLLPSALPAPDVPPADPIPEAADHYRALHVQPDAPAEVIKASWRTLLGRLRQHPDLGGSHGHAQRLNEAWAVLGDTDRRAAYDIARQARAAGVAAFAARLTPWQCPLCRHAGAGPLRVDSRCPHCQSPQAAPPDAGQRAHELLGRRGAVRRDQSHVALVHLGWPSAALPVRWRDLSLTGLSFYAPRAVPPGQRLRLIDTALEGVVEVVGCRAQGRVHAVHARWVTLLLLQATGVFVSAQA